MRIGSQIKGNRKRLSLSQDALAERDTPAGRSARGGLGERILHLLPYLAVIATVGYLLGRLVKLAVTVLS